MSASNRLSQKSNGGEVVSDFNYETRRKNSHRQVWLPGIALMQACEKFFWQTDSADRKYLRRYPAFVDAEDYPQEKANEGEQCAAWAYE
ncbi:hypothetical protein IFM46972_04022 [Aspergillus udagawae]|uniref:Uncharacterized protein n=1 Tax=Aspergillus udagawae TaxID=91492 RepID=A0A8H3NHD9_9EURO|nr:hypothetical protein IFM46972_04022 [Aspergillus udagawae]